MTRHVSGLQQAAIVTPMLSVTVLGRRNDPACYDLRDFLSRNQIGLRWIDPTNAVTVEGANVPPELLENGVYPSVVFGDRSFMSAPKYPELAERLGLQIAPRATTYDVAIVGAGPAGVSGDDLASRAFHQAKRFGAEVIVTRQATSIVPRDGAAETHAIDLDCGSRVHTKAIVIATGVAWRTLDIPGAKALLGRGVYYGASRAEALSARGKDVFLIGGG